MNVVRDSRKFSGHPYIGRIARSSLRQLSFLVRFCRFIHDTPTETNITTDITGNMVTSFNQASANIVSFHTLMTLDSRTPPTTLNINNIISGKLNPSATLSPWSKRCCRHINFTSISSACRFCAGGLKNIIIQTFYFLRLCDDDDDDDDDHNNDIMCQLCLRQFCMPTSYRIQTSSQKTFSSSTPSSRLSMSFDLVKAKR